MSDAGATTGRPVLRVVRGNPTPEELVALTVVLVARSGSAVGRQPARPRSGWVERAAQLRRPPSPGPGAWVRSGRPS